MVGFDCERSYCKRLLYISFDTRISTTLSGAPVEALLSVWLLLLLLGPQATYSIDSCLITPVQTAARQATALDFPGTVGLCED